MAAPPPTTATTTPKTTTSAGARVWIGRAAAAAILVGLAIWGARKIDLGRFAESLRWADWRLVAACALVNLIVCTGAGMQRLRTILRPLPHEGAAAGAWELTSLQLASSAAHNLLPSPAGEVMRGVQLARRHKYPVGSVVAANVFEKVIEALALSAQMAMVAAFGYLPHKLGAPAWGFAIAGAAGAAGVLAFAWRYRAPLAATESPTEKSLGEKLRSRARDFFSRLHEGMYLLRGPRVWLGALAWSLVADAAHAASIGLALAAVGAHVHPSLWFAVVLVNRVAGVIPSTPGQFGVLESGMALVLSAFGVDPARALACAVLVHAAHFIPVTAIGLVELRRQWRS